MTSYHTHHQVGTSLHFDVFIAFTGGSSLSPWRAYFVSENCTGGSRGPIFVGADLTLDLTYPSSPLSLQIKATSFSNSRIRHIFIFIFYLCSFWFGDRSPHALEPHWRIPPDAPVSAVARTDAAAPQAQHFTL